MVLPFYGWAILLAVIVLDLCTAPGHTGGFNVFVDHLIADVPVSRTKLSEAWTGALVFSALLAPLAGLGLDHLGAQALAALAILGLCTGLLGLSTVDSPLEVGLFVCLLRFSGPECLTIAGSTTLNRWFVRRRGRVAVLRSLVITLMVAYPAIVSPAIARLGWRQTYKLLAVVTVAAGGCAAATLRHSPELVGVLPDGDDVPATVPVAGTASPSSSSDDPEWGFRDVLHSPTFWKILAAESVFGIFWSGLALHFVDVFTLRGLDHDHVAALTIPFGVGFLLGLVLTGCVIDGLSKHQRTQLLVGSYCGLALCIAVLLPGTSGTGAAIIAPTTAYTINTRNVNSGGDGSSNTEAAETVAHYSMLVSSEGTAAVWYFVWGAISAVQITVNSILPADLFGRRALGSINGIVACARTTSAALGPMAFAMCKDRTGGYFIAMAGVLVLWFPAVTLLALAPLPPSSRVK